MDVQIDGENGRDAADASIASRKYTTIARAIAHGDNPFRTWSGLISTLEGFAHVIRDRPRHEKHIGVARRCDEAHTEPLEIVDDVVERMNLEFATVT